MKLVGRSAVITGASQGLGRCIAEQFVRDGANVAICARTPEALSKAEAVLRQTCGAAQKVFAMRCDVSREADVNEFVAGARNEFGTVDILVANAGVYGPMGPIETVDWREWVRAFEINLYGVLLPCRAVIPHFKKLGRGKIVIISGGGATNPLPNISSYASAKAAVVRVMETMAHELKAHRIDVNAIAPGALKTRFVEQVLNAGPEVVGAAFYERNLKLAADGGTPLELGAHLCAYLASEQSDGITGRLISAQWDRWEILHERKDELAPSDIYTLRRIIPEDRGKTWN